MQVDAHRALVDDLGHEQMGQSSSRRSPPRAGEGPIQVAAIRQITGLDDEAKRVDYRHGDHGSLEALGIEFADDLSDDLDAVQLVAVDCSRQPYVGTLGPTVDHRDGEGLFRSGWHPGEGEFDSLLAPRRDRHAPDDDLLVPGVVSHSHVRFYVLHDEIGDVHAAGLLDPFEAG